MPSIKPHTELFATILLYEHRRWRWVLQTPEQYERGDTIIHVDYGFPDTYEEAEAEVAEAIAHHMKGPTVISIKRTPEAVLETITLGYN